ncbi:MAG: hypothetical protein GKC04_00240 [Methanomicrobiales archaeon]|nr:hypothetical protein [Methanomicrobiales archaeon]
MTGLFERIFGKKEEEGPIGIAFSDVPRWIEDREIAVKNELRERTASSQQAILDAFNEIASLVASLANTPPEEQGHPKLLRAVETAVPAFVRSMELAVSRHWSNDPISLYPEAADALKAMIRAMKGQGKYLMNCYPGIMQELKSEIRIVGTGINTMTGHIEAAEKELAALETMRNRYTDLLHLAGEYRTAKNRWEDIWSHIPRDEERIRAVTAEIAKIRAHDEINSLNAARDAIEGLTREKSAIGHEYSRTVAASANVLRKAEHAAEGERNDQLIRSIRHVRDLLDHPPHHDPVTLAEGISVIMPDLMRLIGTGDIVLKNKQEKHLFADTEVLAATIRDICTRYGAAVQVLSLRKLEIEDSDLLRTLALLEKKQAGLQANHSHDEETMREIEAFCDGTLEKVPPMLEKLAAAAAVCAGSEVAITGTIPGLSGYAIPERKATADKYGQDK